MASDTTPSHHHLPECSDHPLSAERTPRTQIPDKWLRVAEKLPGPLSYFYVKLFLALLLPTDTFPLIMRKLMMTCGFVWAPFTIGVAIYWIVYGSTYGYGSALVVAIVAIACLGLLSFMPSYLYVRATRTASNSTFNYWIVSMMLFFFVTSLGAPIFPAPLAYFAIIECSVIGGAPLTHTFIHLFLTFLCFGVSASNVNLGHSYDALMTVPNPHLGPPGEAIFFTAMGFSIIFFLVMALLIQSAEYSEKVNAAETAVDMVSVIASHLRCYDTDTVKSLLQDFQQEGIVDTDLIVQFGFLVENLTSYRQHIPQWLINSTTERAKEERLRHLHPNGTTTEDTTGQEDEWSEGSIHMTESEAPDRISEAPSINSCGNRPGSPQQNTAFVETAGTSEHAGLKPPQMGSLTRAGGSSTAFTGTVTFAVIEFQFTDSKIMTRERAMDLFVDRVHELAGETRASLHSFVGNQLLVSWNATHRVLQPELKASKFLFRLKGKTGAPTVTCHGAAVTGLTMATFSGTGKSRALTFTLNEMRCLPYMIHYAEQHHTVVVDKRTEGIANYSFKTMGVDAVTNPAYPDQVIEIYQLITEKTDADDEWMYALSKADAENPYQIVTDALQYAIAGRFGDALERLDEAEAKKDEPVMTSCAKALEEQCRSLLLVGAAGEDFLDCERKRMRTKELKTKRLNTNSTA